MPTTYPKYPFINTEMRMKTFVDNILDTRKLKLLESLKIDNEAVNSLKIKLKDKHIVHTGSNKENIRFTASVCNKLNSVKTTRGLSTLAHDIVFGKFTKKNNTLERNGS